MLKKEKLERKKIMIGSNKRRAFFFVLEKKNGKIKIIDAN